jgi:competence protein ComEC
MLRLLPVVILAIALFATATAYVPDTLTVTFLEVGEADAAIVQTPNGHTMLVDAGRQGNSVTVSDALAAEGIERLDYVVGTHEDADHIGGMVPVLSYMELGEYVNNGVEDPDPSDTTLFLRTYLASRGITPRAVEAGDTLALDPANVTVTVLNPPADPGSDDNEASVVLRLVYGTQSFLLAGDAEQTAEGWMLASSRPLGSRILKVGHHGGATATSAGFVAAVDPEIAVISVGPNAYGHPSQAVVKRLQDSGATVFSTGASGTVRVTATRTGYTVTTVDGPELPGTLPGASMPPTDPDFDGVFDDLNGNGRRDFADVVMLFNQMTWIAANEPVERFDFNGNGRIDFADVVVCFNRIGEPIVTPSPSPTPTATVTTPSTTTTSTTPTETVTTPSTTVTSTTTTAAPAYTLAITGLDLQNEWVSVRNTGTAPVQMQGCTISDASVHVYTFPSFTLASEATVTVYTGAGTNTATALYWGLGSSVWNNTGDTATLKRPDGSVISSLTRP